MNNIIEWLSKDREYARNIVRLAGVRLGDAVLPDKAICFDVLGVWKNNQWVGPHTYSIPGNGSRLLWRADQPTRLFTKSLRELTQTFSEMLLPDCVVVFMGYINPNDKKVYFQHLSIKPTPEHISTGLEPKLWIKNKMWTAEELIGEVKMLQDKMRRLKGMGFD